MENLEYNVLIESILRIPALNEEIKNMEKHTCALNLVTPSWREKLEFSSEYQIHKKRKVKYSKGHHCGGEQQAYIRRIISRDHVFNVIVAGEFNFQKSLKNEISIISNICEPLDLIGEAMKENDEEKLHTGGRFWVKMCHPLFCFYCTAHHKENNLPFVRKNWCVLNLKIFNGKEINHSSAAIVQPALMIQKDFMAIFHMKIFHRITFGDNSFKISGCIEDMILFQKAFLNLENVAQIQYLPNFAIEYPHEENDEEVTTIVEKK